MKGISCTIISKNSLVYSLDLLKLNWLMIPRLQRKEGRQFYGLVDAYKKTLKYDGIVGIYGGLNISYVGMICYHGLYLVVWTI